jgi:uncharacterized membrane protein YhhN
LAKRGLIWLYLFLIATMADITFILEGNSELRFYSKPLIIASLIAYFYQISKPASETLLVKAILSALIFSWVGDIVLLWEELFLYGLGAFLIAQLCYIIAFKVAQKAPESIFNQNFIRNFLINLPLYFGAAFIYYLIHPNLGAYKLPVAIYIIVIVSMATTARERFGKCNSLSFWQVFIGACLFFTSDALIALDRFYIPFPESGVLIMGTYAVAQLLIVMGIRSFLIDPK